MNQSLLRVSALAGKPAASSRGEGLGDGRNLEGLPVVDQIHVAGLLPDMRLAAIRVPDDLEPLDLIAPPHVHVQPVLPVTAPDLALPDGRERGPEVAPLDQHRSTHTWDDPPTHVEQVTGERPRVALDHRGELVVLHVPQAGDLIRTTGGSRLEMPVAEHLLRRVTTGGGERALRGDARTGQEGGFDCLVPWHQVTHRSLSCLIYSGWSADPM